MLRGIPPAFAGGVSRIGMPGISLAVEQIASETLIYPGSARRTEARAGRTVGYLMAMEVSPLLMQSMSEADKATSFKGGCEGSAPADPHW